TIRPMIQVSGKIKPSAYRPYTTCIGVVDGAAGSAPGATEASIVGATVMAYPCSDSIVGAGHGTCNRLRFGLAAKQTARLEAARELVEVGIGHRHPDQR